MTATAVALMWAAGVVAGLMGTTVFFLRRQVLYLRRRQLKLESILENQDARLFMLEQEMRWLSERSNELSELQR